MVDHSTTLLAAQINRSLQRAVVARQAYVDNIENQTIKNGNIQGFVAIDAAGEAVVTVTFPYELLELPLFHPGLSLADNNWLTDGNFPMWSATVVNWITVPAGESIAYVGAVIGIVVIGPGSMKSILHYSFQAQAYTNPTGANQTVTGAL